MVLVYKISAVTLLIKNMDKSCKFYSRIPGFRAVYGGSKNDLFTTFEIGNKEKRGQMKDNKMIISCLNLELLKRDNDNSQKFNSRNANFGRIIFHTDNVDELYYQLKHDKQLNKSLTFENEPTDAPWGERFFHIRDPDYYQLSFAQPINSNRDSI
jgi:catechol 2,3-dioxygenase-like lactoylglutathione lyase family enzyme